MIDHVERPWGWYETISDVPGSKVKRIHVNAGHKLSLQQHHWRAEHWVVVQGVAVVTLDDREFELTVGEHCKIAQMQPHRLENRTDRSLEIIEVQIGQHLSEGDIVRLKDSYGRA